MKSSVLHKINKLKIYLKTYKHIPHFITLDSEKSKIRIGMNNYRILASIIMSNN